MRSPESQDPVRTPDTILRNGMVRTLDGRGTVASAIAIAGGALVGIGTDADASKWAGRTTVSIDVGGRTILPAFTDSHTHFQKGAIQRRHFIDYLELQPRTVDEALVHLRTRVAATAPGTWIRGEALNEHHLAERRLPNRHELDATTQAHPVVLFGIGNHVLTANSRALALAGIDRETTEPDGGRIDRDETGAPTGVLRELGKLRLDPNRADSVLPRLDAANRSAAIAQEARYLHSQGIVAIHDIVAGSDEVAAYMNLWADGALTLRVQLLVRAIESRISLDQIVALGLRQPFGDEWLRLGGVKFSVDGICAWKNAAVYDPYPGEPDNCGLVRIPQDELTAAVGAAEAAGLRVAVHAIGQRAVDMTLAAFEANGTSGTSRLRHRIEHAYLPPLPGQLERVKALGLTASPQPTFLRDFGDAWVETWGEEAMQSVMPLRTMMELGIPVIASSDYPCVPPSPLAGIAAAVNRTTRSGCVLGRSQAIGVERALMMYTRDAAYAGHEEDRRGTLSVGKQADVIVVSADPVAVQPNELVDLSVDLTMVGGTIVHAGGGFQGLMS